MSKGNIRALGALSSADIAKRLSKSSVLCLPLGAIEQHGPHLPLNTDLVIAENVARLMAERLATNSICGHCRPFPSACRVSMRGRRAR